MSDLIAQTLALPGLGWLLLTCFVAAVVYGFAGFGAALIFMPVATALLPVELAIAAFSVSGLSSLFTVLPRALGNVDRRGVSVMILAALPGAAIGLWILKIADVTLLRWAVVGVSAVTLLALAAGWRYATVPRLGTRAGVGFASGLVGGITGLTGPVMVLFQLAGADGAARSRATALVFLTLTSVALLPLMAIQGLLTFSCIPLGFLMFLPYAAGARLGQALFDPAREGVYRVVALAIIGLAILLGLPVWD